MADLDKALAAAREAIVRVDRECSRTDDEAYLSECAKAAARLADLLAALDAARGEAVATVQTITSLVGETRKCIIGPAEVIDSLPVGTAVYAAPPAALVPEGGLRDSVLNSAKFRASCYALVGIVEGIEGLGRCWAANGERLKDTPEWVAFYNCVASMRNGTFDQASAEQAQQPAAAAPACEVVASDEDGWLRAVYQRIVGNAHPAEGTRLNVAYAIARHLSLDCPMAKVIVHAASDYTDSDPNIDLGERYGVDWEYAKPPAGLAAVRALLAAERKGVDDAR